MNRDNGKDLEENQFDSERECGEFDSHPLPAHNLEQIFEFERKQMKEFKEKYPLSMFRSYNALIEK